ncbi:MAG TPA: glycosyltransferase [Verrucomicrobiota bacterium]|nr:glycosyltransferase [Verrucomicrobiota bacterium]
MLEARNSHPGNLWSLMAEEYSRWDCQLPPVYPKHHMRQQRSVFLADYIFSPAKFVTESFVSRGFPSDRVLDLPYPVDLRMFSPLAQPRPKDRPLTIINTGLLTLRKGTPYLLEAFEMVRKQVPNARLLLTRGMADNFEPLFRKRNWDRLPIEWAGRLPHGELCRRLQSADIFVMPSIEDGFALAVTEAMGCGLPVITTRNTGAVDCVKTGVTGSVVPIRNSAAIADEILGWWEKIRKGEYDARQPRFDPEAISTEAFAKRLVELLRRIGLAGSQ